MKELALIILLCFCWKPILVILCLLFAFVISGVYVIFSKIKELLEGETKMRPLEDSVKEDDIEEGDYVKTRNGYTGEVFNINDFRPPETKYCLDIGADDLVFCGEKDIMKHSKKIEDIINEKHTLEILNDYANDFYIDGKYPYLVEAIRDIMYLYSKEKGE